MQAKPFWQSKTLWINVVAIVGEFLGAYGTALSAEERIMLLGLINIIVRVVTKGAVSII